MKNITLNNGVEMPILGFGVFQITDAEECRKSVLTALEAGYRLIDTARSYMNEEAVGQAIKDSGIARDAVFITSKLWIQKDGFEGTKKSFEASLKRLQLDYLDLYLIHQPFGDVYGEWRAMEDLYKEGKIRAIGVSNFQPDRMMDLMIHHEVVPAVNQIEVNPFQQRTDTEKFFRDHQIQIEAWAPFAEGRNNLFTNEVLTGIAKKYDKKSIAQVILRWLVQRDMIAISKSVNTDRIKENIAVFDFELDDDDMNLIVTLDTKTSSFFDHGDTQIVERLGNRKLDY